MGGEFRLRLGIQEICCSLLPVILAQVSGAIVAGCVCTAESRPHHFHVKKLCVIFMRISLYRRSFPFENGREAAVVVAHLIGCCGTFSGVLQLRVASAMWSLV